MIPAFGENNHILLHEFTPGKQIKLRSKFLNPFMLAREDFVIQVFFYFYFCSMFCYFINCRTLAGFFPLAK